MTIQIDLPPEVQQRLGGDQAHVSRAAQEAMLVELFRMGKVLRGELSRALGLSWHETEALFHRHRVTEHMMDLEDFKRELAERGRL